MKRDILFIHGMFQNAVSWRHWVQYFEKQGYTCHAPSWLYHEGTPGDLRAHPSPDLGHLRLQQLIDQFEMECSRLDNPIVIGHSVGALIAQVLVFKKMASAGIFISSVAPNNMLSFDWNYLKNAATIMNPLKGNEPFEMDRETFHKAFCYPMSEEEASMAYERTATHDSRNVMRDCMTTYLTLDVPHPPVLFIAGSDDHIIPAKLNSKNADAYTDPSSQVDYTEFAGRGHFICGQQGWHEVVEHCNQWLKKFNLPGGTSEPNPIGQRAGGR